MPRSFGIHATSRRRPVRCGPGCGTILNIDVTRANMRDGSESERAMVLARSLDEMWNQGRSLRLILVEPWRVSCKPDIVHQRSRWAACC